MILPHATATEVLIWGIVLHLFADWFLQNDWMANKKSNLLHPAAWVHSGIHMFFALLVFPWWGALIVFATHILIDTRTPLVWWGNLIRQTKMISGPATDSPTWGESSHNVAAMSVAFWRDQVAHIVVIALVALLWKGIR